MTTILIIDDDLQIQRLLTQFLEGAGYQTLTASDGDKGIAAYKEKRPEVVITDIVMPEKEGLEVIMELKQINPNAKIIAISGGGRINPKEYLSMAKRLGAAAIIEKPFNEDKLLAKVETVLD